MPTKKIFVKFGSLSEPTQVKCILLPKNDGKQPEVVILRKLLHAELLADSTSIISLGGSQSTPVNDILLLKFDEDYGEVIDVSSSTIFDEREKNVLVKLRQTEIAVSNGLPISQQHHEKMSKYNPVSHQLSINAIHLILFFDFRC
jgi:hypothetical protein